MKLEVSKEWCIEAANMEGDAEIGAGARPIRNYDQKSYDLAEHFLQDELAMNTEGAKDDLAKTIQQAVEDWFFANPKIAR